MKSKDASSQEKNKLLSQLTRAAFWNVNFDKLDYLLHKKLIIERIIDYGLENDEIIMWKMYPYKDIKKVALNMENLHGEIIAYMSLVLNVKEKKFKCYGKKQWYQK